MKQSIPFCVKCDAFLQTKIHLNLGKDFHRDQMEVIGRGDPGAMLMINGVDYELYRRGAHTFLTEEKVIIL